MGKPHHFPSKLDLRGRAARQGDVSYFMPKGNSMCFTNRQIVNKQTNRKKGFSKQREEKELIENAFGSSTNAKHEPLECDAKKKKKKPATCVVSVKNSEEWQEFITSYLLGVKKKTKNLRSSFRFISTFRTFISVGGKRSKSRAQVVTRIFARAPAC